MSRPRWHASARYVGNAPWVPFEIANALQQQVDALAQEGSVAEDQAREGQAVLRSAQAEIEGLRRDQVPLRDRIEELELELAELADTLEPTAESSDSDPGSEELERARSVLREMKGDLDRAHRHRDEALDRGRREERLERLASTAELHDGLRRSIAAAPADGPWAEGQRALLALVEEQIRHAGAESFGAQGDAFDPTVHEAVAVEVGDTPGTISSVVKAGFRLHDGTLVRPASVVVTAES